jgi:tyrosine-specific transport protein
MMDTKATPVQIFGAILLIAGSCIGAGMLALPIVTGAAGFGPATVAFLFCWLYMTSTALILLEVNLWLGVEISIITMARRTLGPIGEATAWSTFLFLFYCVLVAYASASGTLVTDFFNGLWGWELPIWGGSLVLSLIIGLIVYLGTQAVDKINRFLMVGLIATYVALVALGMPHVNSSLLTHRNWGPTLFAIPVIIVSFGFHNMIPSITTYLRRRARPLQLTMLIGGFIPLLVYLLWELIILGIVPMSAEGFGGAASSDRLGTEALRDAVGESWVVIIAQYFALFAILTSFLAQALSLRDFLGDGFKLSLRRPGNRILMVLLAMVPPFLFGVYDPNAFINALQIAGGIGAMILFGILPCLMVWSKRYRSGDRNDCCMPGGRVVLCVFILIAATVMCGEIYLQLRGSS